MWLLLSGQSAPYPPDCWTPAEPHWVTGYSREQFPGRTADGTSVWSGEWLVAAHPRYPFGAVVWIDRLGHFRVADRGLLGTHHLDVLVSTDAEAYRLTGEYQACRVR